MAAATSTTATHSSNTHAEELFIAAPVSITSAAARAREESASCQSARAFPFTSRLWTSNTGGFTCKNWPLRCHGCLAHPCSILIAWHGRHRSGGIIAFSPPQQLITPGDISSTQRHQRVGRNPLTLPGILSLHEARGSQNCPRLLQLLVLSLPAEARL